MGIILLFYVATQVQRYGMDSFYMLFTSRVIGKYKFDLKASDFFEKQEKNLCVHQGLTPKKTLVLNSLVNENHLKSIPEKSVFRAMQSINEIGEMQDFLEKSHKKRTVSRYNFQIKEILQFQYSTFDIPF